MVGLELSVQLWDEVVLEVCEELSVVVGVLRIVLSEDCEVSVQLVVLELVVSVHVCDVETKLEVEVLGMTWVCVESVSTLVVVKLVVGVDSEATSVTVKEVVPLSVGEVLCVEVLVS